MKKEPIVLSMLLCLYLFLGIICSSYADDAQVLPKGVVAVILDGKYYFPFDKKFDKEGKKEDIDADSNANLNSNVFAGLRLVEQFFGMAPGSASIGRSVVSFEYQGQDFMPLLQYGLTDRLTVGAKIPYYWRKNKVEARLDTTAATVGKNPFVNSLTPLSVPGTVPLTTADAQHLIGGGLDINGDGIIEIRGFGFKPLKTSSRKGIADIEIGGRYQYFKTDKWRLAFTGGVRMPTGEVDDPDDLGDIGIGSGAYTLLFQFNHDYIGIKNLVLNATLRYDLVFPNRERLRIPDDVNQPITANKENVDRDIGDAIELEVSGAYEFLKGFTFSSLYKYGYKLKNRVSGDRDFSYESLESETRATQHVGIASLYYSTIPLFQAKKFPLPMAAGVSYRNRFAGTNVLRSQYISLTLGFYF
jgi:hypothetical protein